MTMTTRLGAAALCLIAYSCNRAGDAREEAAQGPPTPDHTPDEAAPDASAAPAARSPERTPSEPATAPPVEGSGTAAALRDPTPVDVASHTLAPVRCELARGGLFGAIGFDVVRDIEVVGDRVWLADADANLRRYRLEPGGGCVLTPDPAFGTAGMLDLPRDIETITSAASGLVVASSGIFESYLFPPGSDLPGTTCTAPSHGYLAVAPDGLVAFGRFVGSAIVRAELSDAGCAAAPWTALPVFSNVQAIGFLADLAVFGGRSAEETPIGRATQLVAVRGDEPVWRQGNTTDPLADDTYSWVHAIEPAGEDLVVLDAHAGLLHVVDGRGTHLARVPMGPLLGHAEPHVGDIDSAGDDLWLVASEPRGAGVAAFDAYVYRLPGAATVRP
jgi:hypothetical protein